MTLKPTKLTIISDEGYNNKQAPVMNYKHLRPLHASEHTITKRHSTQKLQQPSSRVANRAQV